jgi:enoyl-CoA hydratase/carnithine racemase
MVQPVTAGKGMDVSDILVSDVDAVRVLTLNRPDRLNAWTYDLGDLYFDLLDEAEDSADVRVVVVTGAASANR